MISFPPYFFIKLGGFSSIENLVFPLVFLSSLGDFSSIDTYSKFAVMVSKLLYSELSIITIAIVSQRSRSGVIAV